MNCAISINPTQPRAILSDPRLVRWLAAARRTLAWQASELRRELASQSMAKRILYIAILILPGSVVVLPLVFWLDRRASRWASSRPDAQSGHGEMRAAPSSL